MDSPRPERVTVPHVPRARPTRVIKGVAQTFKAPILLFKEDSRNGTDSPVCKKTRQQVDSPRPSRSIPSSSVNELEESKNIKPLKMSAAFKVPLPGLSRSDKLAAQKRRQQRISAAVIAKRTTLTLSAGGEKTQTRQPAWDHLANQPFAMPPPPPRRPKVSIDDIMAQLGRLTASDK